MFIFLLWGGCMEIICFNCVIFFFKNWSWLVIFFLFFVYVCLVFLWVFFCEGEELLECEGWVFSFFLSIMRELICGLSFRKWFMWILSVLICLIWCLKFVSLVWSCWLVCLGLKNFFIDILFFFILGLFLM